ncbi:hypothetical protein [Aquimarina rubra]|uniref:Uncharacterized protein n=1 Tax=Aquimarina rubra TaxID=1920033 RepID=A0ABW5LIA1_9FLAO
MRKLRNLPILFVFISMITYGNIYDVYSNSIYHKYSDSIKQCCLHEYAIYEGLDVESTSNSENYLYLDYTDVNYLSPVLFNLLKNKEMLKITAQAIHINKLLERKRSQYQLYQVNLFGQLTSPVNNEINHQKAQTPRMEGFGIRFRF